ncbi:hypothetical protein C8Q75DRAFT_869956 [Abortiporus biennis]|nr:hypothetical protein C8Q75DRAFT_869956 [Abortiporus biennis]
MSDEYASSGYKGFLVNQSANVDIPDQSDYTTHNYPSEGDTTAEGGYGSPVNSWSDLSQRGRPDKTTSSSNSLPNNSSNSSTSNHGLIDQSTNGGPIGNEINDAIQGEDEFSREEYEHEVERDFAAKSPVGGGHDHHEHMHDGLNPYGRNPDNEKEASDMLASQFVDSRNREYGS